MLTQVFNLYFRRRTFVQVLFDLSLIVLGLLVVAVTLVDKPYRIVSLAATHGISLGACMLVVNTASGFYRQQSDRSLGQTCLRALLVLAIVLPLAYGIFSFVPNSAGVRDVLQFAAMMGVAVVTVNRVYAEHADQLKRSRHRVLIFGAGATAKMVGETLLKGVPKTTVVGYIAGPNEVERPVAVGNVLPYGELSLFETAKALGANEIVVALTERRGGSMPMRDLLDCKLRGIRVSDAQTHFENACGQIKLDHVNAGSLIFGSGFDQSSIRTSVKRGFDIVFSVVLLLLSLPLMVVTAFLIRLESRGNIFYTQERVGENGQVFRVLKFRSMRIDAERDGMPRWAAAKDDRITKVGRVIRTYRIDEIPQIFNVLKGEMSLVGPRPERPFFVTQLVNTLPYYAVRHSMKPGVTGWAQVKYQYGATMEDSREKLQYDLYYVKNQCLKLDLIILMRTVKVVISGQGSR
jgi:sugar transferase (PEP-CTERM system associated)